MADFKFLSASEAQRITRFAFDTERTLIFRNIEHKIEKAAFAGKSSVAVRYDLSEGNDVRDKLDKAGFTVFAGDQVSTISWVKRNKI